MHTDPEPPISLVTSTPALPGRPIFRPPPSPANGAGPVDRATAVTALYQVHALGLVRLAHVMLGDRASAEDIVQEAFCGLYRRWSHLSDQGKALQYVRSAVLNGCRSAIRRARRPQPAGQPPGDESAEAVVLTRQERLELLAALRKLPHRQREVLVLRFYLDLTEAQIAARWGSARAPSARTRTAH